jgi:hypothetical protein
MNETSKCLEKDVILSDSLHFVRGDSQQLRRDASRDRVKVLCVVLEANAESAGCLFAFDGGRDGPVRSTLPNSGSVAKQIRDPRVDASLELLPKQLRIWDQAASGSCAACWFQQSDAFRCQNAGLSGADVFDVRFERRIVGQWDTIAKLINVLN